MSIFVYRNQTVEPLFSNLKDVTLSDYGSINFPEGNFLLSIWCYFITPGFDENEILKEIEDIQTKLQLAITNNEAGNFLIFTLDGRYLPSWQLSSNVVSESISEFNKSIYDLSINSSTIKIVKIDELFNQFKKGNEDNGLNRYRLTMKLEHRLKGDNEIGIFYRIQEDIDRIDPISRKILGFKFAHKFDLTN